MLSKILVNSTSANVCLAPQAITLIVRFMGPTWGPSGADRTQVGPMLAPWTLLFGYLNWCWISVRWVVRNNLKWVKFEKHYKSFLRENVFGYVVCKMRAILLRPQCVNTLRPIQNGSHFANTIFKFIFLNENCCISIQILLKFVPKGQINNKTALVQIMAWRRTGDKPLSEPIMA